MATLADALRGYVPPTDSPMSDVVTNYANNIAPQAQANLLRQAGNAQNAIEVTPDLHLQVKDPQAFNEFMNELPNMAGTINPTRKEVLLQQFNQIAGGEKPVRSAVVLIGDKIFTGNTHTQAFDKAIQEGVVQKVGKKFIYPKDAEVNSDLFMLNDGRIVDRLTASKMLDVGSSEGALRDNKMQIRPANSMPIDEYMRQAQEIKKNKISVE
jgi:hypothetical protein